jgi:hypothetical protein
MGEKVRSSFGELRPAQIEQIENALVESNVQPKAMLKQQEPKVQV